MRASPIRRLILTAIALPVIYMLGIAVRQHYGIAVVVQNLSGRSVRDLRIILEPEKKTYQVNDLQNGQHSRVFIRPSIESHINLEYLSETGARKSQLIVGYVEAGYCGKANVRILADDQLESSESIDPVMCKQSWFAFR